MTTCRTCRMFDSTDNSIGLCRAMPPVVIPVVNRNRSSERETKPFTAWPVVRHNDWCGEYQA